MMRSMYSGVAGLKTHQTKMDVIGNNIANVNTTSYKSQSITFSDLMYQTTQNASGATETKGGVNARQIGLGAKSGAINTAITSQGATQTTNNPFDIMITGQSFFVVNNGNENLYTRDGSFYVDGAGNLAMQSNGYLVQGWVAQEDRETGEISVNKNGGRSSLQIMSAANYTYSPASTTAAQITGNIDAADSNVISVDGKTLTLEFYDNKGYLYTGKFTLKNTDTDGLYALSLTDIIDSNGKSINDNKDMNDLMSQITFGDTNSEDRVVMKEVIPGYSFVTGTDADHITINKAGGDVKYNNVTPIGKLSELQNSFPGLLESVYGLTSNNLESLYGGKEGVKSATYSIDNNGTLTVSYVNNIVPSTSFNTGTYSFNNNANVTPAPTYFTAKNSQVAYKVPVIPAGSTSIAGDASTLSKEMLVDVFGFSADAAEAYTQSGANEYTYKYESTGVMTISKNISIATTGSQGTVVTSDLLEQFAKMGYTDDSGNHKLMDDINAYTGGDMSKLANLKYVYNSNGQLTITQSVSVAATKRSSQALNINETDAQALADFIGNNTKIGTPDATELDYATIKAIAEDSSNPNQAVAEQIRAAIEQLYEANKSNALDGTDIDDVTFKITSLTGSDGILIKYPSSKLEDKNFPDVNSASKVYTADVEGRAEYKKDAYDIGKPKYVYQNTGSTYGKSYYVTDDKLENTMTVTQENMDFFTNVFGAITGVNVGTEYVVNIGQYGTLAIGQRVAGEPIAMVGDNGYTVATNENGSLKYSSTSAYKDVPTKGKISDLLTTVKGDCRELLSKVYGISDKAADAYGVDGTYEIITTEGSDFGKINLTMGNRTIQLKFNDSNGSIVSADGDMETKKANITFGQAFHGLEAFGFQASETNAAELERAYTISVDFSNLTNYNTNGSSTIKATKGDIHSLNTGRAVGEMNGVSVSTDGQIYANYSNGQTKLLGQIASAQFANASGLSKEGDNLYSATLNSGEATVQDITTDGGYMNTGVLEMSNVDLSSQFTEMITTQRGFQANSRIITVSDTLLEELTNLKR